MIKYIEVNDTGHVQGYSELSGEVILPNMIQVDDFSVADGKKWDFTNLVWVTNTEHVAPYKRLDKNGFRDRFDYAALLKVDWLEAKLEDDTFFDQAMPNSDGTAAGRNAMRNPIRTGFKDMAAMPVFDVNDVRVIRFFDALVVGGIITQAWADNFLDSTDLE